VAICHRKQGYEAEALAASNNGQGFDVILENLANVNLDRDTKMIKNGSIILIVGNRGEAAFNPRTLMAPEASIQGVALFSSSQEELGRIGKAIVAGIQNGE